MITYSELADNKINNISIETEAIRHSFSKTIKDFGVNTYKPFLVLFSSPEDKTFVITSREVSHEQDYYTAISEMLFAYSSFSSESMLLAIDVAKEIQGVQHDVLEIYMACDQFCYVYSYPYSIDSNNHVQWNDSLFQTTEIEKLDKAYDTTSNVHATLEIIEALYLHVNLHSQFFDVTKIKSFFDLNGFEYVDLNKESENKNSLTL
jgi:hypothetical protein